MRVYSENCVLIENRKASSDGYLLTFKSARIATDVRPGQFVEVKCMEGSVLRRPFSVYRTDAGSFSLFIKVAGKGSKWLSELRPGANTSVIGPLGNGYTISEKRRVLITGGGCGVASLFLLAKELKGARVSMDMVFGFGSPDEIPEIVLQPFRELADTLIVTVDRGDYPVKGNVLEALKRVDLSRYDGFYGCGPVKMLKALAGTINPEKAEVSLEARMACGFGVCYGCSIITSDGSNKRVCVDGPVFKMNEVDWNAL